MPMWITTTQGFISAVADPKDPEHLIIRARDRRSLESMIARTRLAATVAGHSDTPNSQFSDIVTGEGTDYRWRVRASKTTFALFLSHEVLNFLTYRNFKNALKQSRGKVWADAASNVWFDMLAVDDGPKNGHRVWDLSGAPEPVQAASDGIANAFADEKGHY